MGLDPTCQHTMVFAYRYLLCHSRNDYLGTTRELQLFFVSGAHNNSFGANDDSADLVFSPRFIFFFFFVCRPVKGTHGY